MEEFGRLLNVIDVEATCWKDMPPPGSVNEIIEIGVCVVDTVAWERVLKRSIMVRPQRSTVSAFCTELTGITQAQVDAGISFADACGVLRDELHSDSRAWASWGDYDRKQFERQCSAGRVAYPFSARHTNAKVPFTAAFELRKRPGMAQALEVAGLPLEGRHHSGADDAWNIGALIIELARRDHPIG
ncbi:inhibitor of KinA sporulation pathway (predicted exonuclease) [Allocatelliglobosispora scoriae]|uniref:Inhibitor of KinA sporulation pathway (Predicted exonuclease) n=1 Tax=Allocatelliglobosispora scoriae TaxID=643052 RepID=A0A841BW01_9ACTN|nr:3'-5' exonuclease [Allocatelliglobosispora scoriae]MBB5872344.1 inhibitor of KinA sporulation pathway (predicted exonuclease) [Allocatelliglobosispora scoriae]